MSNTPFDTMPKVGQIISYRNFPDREDCYQIGRVITVTDYIFVCDTISITVNGEDQQVNDLNDVFAAVPEGAHCMDGMYPGRVTFLTEEDL